MIGDKIRETRKKNGLSLADLAERIGVSDSYLSQLERNNVDPSISVLRKLSSALNVPIVTFFDATYEEPVVIRSTEVTPVSVLSDDLVLTPLSPSSDSGTHMEIFKFSISSENEPVSLLHDGETCLHLLSGSLTLFFENQILSLHTGDSITIHANTTYRLSSETGTSSGILCSTGHLQKEAFL
nr:helix-turn-helix transcriptional regulator [uncultured Mediterraneibacter sp.]